MRYRLMATYQGVPYEAGLGPTDADVVLFAACPPPEDLGFEPATGHWRKPVSRAEVALWESRPTGVFRGEPCLVLDDLGDRLHIAYLGDDPYQAARLGYHQVEPAVFEVVTSREAVTELSEERVPHQFQLWQAAASWRPPEELPPVERLAPPGGLAGPATWAGPEADPLPPRPAIIVPRPGAVTDATPVSSPAANAPGSAPPADPVPAAPAGPATTTPEAGLPLPPMPARPAAAPAEPGLQPTPAAAHGQPRRQPTPAATTPEAGLPLPSMPAMPAANPAEPGLRSTPAAPAATRAEPILEPVPAMPAGPAGPVVAASRAEPAAPEPTRTRRGRAAGRSRNETRWIFSELASLAAIPSAAYAVDEEVDGATCLVRTAHGFEVFTASGGARHEVRLFHDEEAAYFYLFGLLTAEAVRDGRLVPLQR